MADRFERLEENVDDRAPPPPPAPLAVPGPHCIGRLAVQVDVARQLEGSRDLQEGVKSILRAALADAIYGDLKRMLDLCTLDIDHFALFTQDLVHAKFYFGPQMRTAITLNISQVLFEREPKHRDFSRPRYVPAFGPLTEEAQKAFDLLYPEISRYVEPSKETHG